MNTKRKGFLTVGLVAMIAIALFPPPLHQLSLWYGYLDTDWVTLAMTEAVAGIITIIVVLWADALWKS